MKYLLGCLAGFGIITGFILLIVLLGFYGNKKSNEANSIRNFIDRKAMNELFTFVDLKVISRNEDYGRSMLVCNDTLFGIGKYDFYIQNLKKPNSFKYFKNDTFPTFLESNFKYRSYGTIGDKSPDFEYIKNGFVYFNADKFIYRINLKTGHFKIMLKSKSYSLFPITRIFVTDKLTIIKRLGGVFILDNKSENVVWKYRYESESGANSGLHVLFEDSFVFIDDNVKTYSSVNGKIQTQIDSKVICYDLINLCVKWERKIPYAYNQRDDDMPNDGKSKFAFEIGRTLYIMDTKSDSIFYSKKDKNIYLNNYSSSFENNFFYYGANDSIICLNLKTKLPKWKTKGYPYWYFKNYIIQYAKDRMTVFDKQTGKVKKNIMYKNSTGLVEVLGNYMVYDDKIYQVDSKDYGNKVFTSR